MGVLIFIVNQTLLLFGSLCGALLTQQEGTTLHMKFALLEAIDLFAS